MLLSAQNVLAALTFLTPFEISEKRIRIGPACDGGYILADILDTSPVLSFGAGADISFEVELAELGHQVSIFDHTVSVLPGEHERVKHFLKGVAGHPSDDGVFVDLEGALALSGLTGREDLILKMDVEGSEFGAIANSQSLRSFRQIALEIHWLSQLADHAFRASFVAMMKRLINDFTIFHVHGNNCASLHIVGGEMTEVGEMGGVPVVDVLEISLVRNDLVEKSPNRTIYPTPLDYRNRPDRPDHLLQFFPFETCAR